MKPILLLAGLLLLAGAATLSLLTKPEDRADLSYVNPSGIHTLDPARMSWTQDLRIALNIWEGLTTYDPTTTAPIPGAALAPTVSDDGLTYTFTLRPDARWSNGDPVRSADFVRGWRRALEPGTAADYSFFFTDHLAGAAEYVRWRQDATAVLAPLSRLASGWGGKRRAGSSSRETPGVRTHPGAGSTGRARTSCSGRPPCRPRNG